MNVLFYWAAVVSLAKSAHVHQYTEAPSQEPVEVEATRTSRHDQQPIFDETSYTKNLVTPPGKDKVSTASVTANILSRPTRSYYMGSGSVTSDTAARSSGATTLTKAMPSHPPLSPPPSASRIYQLPTPIRIIRRIPTTPLPQPYFDPSTPTNISAQLGMHAFLPCTIRNLNNNSISWIRSRDSHILTVDRYTFIADERFQAWHEEDSETWTLQVKYVQERDAGRYECQISTEPKMSHFVHFHVVIPLVHIPGGPDIYVKSGSTVTLKCVISGALILPEYIFWYQGTERVLAEQLTGGRQVFVERISDDTTIGTLIITKASPRDQGSYTCVPASLPTASVTLHVLNAGEHPAAMHHGGGPLSQYPPPFSLLLLCLVAGWLSLKELISTSSTAHLPNSLPR